MNTKRPLILIPMSGYGERFRIAGYSVPKPLIKVDGIPIIHRVIDLFGPENDFIFICNSEHLKEPKYDMQGIIESKVPHAKIIGIEPHSLGPSWAISQVMHLVDDTRQVIVNYCDFFCLWNYSSFLSFVKRYNPDGVIPAYKDFHPHSLGSTNYAYLKSNGLNATAISEKEPFTQNKLSEYASTGTYYFKSGKLLKECLNYQFEKNIKKNNEFYISLAYESMFEKNMYVKVYPILRFMQWGTPQDLEEYLYWSKYFVKRTELLEGTSTCTKMLGELIILASGEGKRFQEKGYDKIKPLIEVNGTQMISSIVGNYNNSFKVNICERIGTNISANLNISGEVVLLTSVTRGQSQSALQALEKLSALDNFDNNSPVTVATCDSDISLQPDELSALLSQDVDMIVWTTDDYVYGRKNPSAYGWVTCDGDTITNAFVKEMPPGDAKLITGNFTFRNAYVMKAIISYQEKNDIKTNNEYYLDDCIKISLKMGLNVKALNVGRFASWGTPDELETYNYWQMAFSVWDQHPYSIANDQLLDNNCKNKLEKQSNILEANINAAY